MIATDLDGTLLRSDNSVSARTRQSLHRARDRGIDIVLATGRPPRWIPPVVEQIGHFGPVVCANGAILYDPDADEILAIRTVPIPPLHRAIEAIRAVDPSIGFAIETPSGFGVDPNYVNAWPLPDNVRRAPTEELPTADTVKMLARSADYEPAQLAAIVQAAIGDELALTWGSSFAGALLEMHAPGVDKSAALSDLADAAGIHTDEVATFGDMPNDLGMIRWAGTGVAMGNADPVVKDAADLITTTNQEDGVAVQIETWLGE